MPGAVLIRAALAWIMSCCAALSCALLRCGSTRPWPPYPDRTDLDLKLELSEHTIRQELVAIETCGDLSQLEFKIRFCSEAGRSKRGRSRTEAKRADNGRDTALECAVLYCIVDQVVIGVRVLTERV